MVFGRFCVFHFVLFSVKQEPRDKRAFSKKEQDEGMS